MTDLDQQIRDRAFEHLGGQTSLDEFEDWFVPRSWADRTALVVELDHLFAERSLLGPAEFDEELRQMVSTFVDAPATISGSAAETIEVGAVRLGGGSETLKRHLAFADR